ncbi:DEAD-like helicase [Vibrio phage vB_pir03]|nr:DEAD-like helicase [Vibrio phage vB_pir03]
MDPEYDQESFDSILNILPVVRVKEEGEYINVMGFWARNLASDIKRRWKSGRVSGAIFVELNARSFICHKFFALEVDYMLSALIEDGSKVRTDKMTLESIRTALREKTWLAKMTPDEPRQLNYKNLKRLNVTPLVNQKEFLEVIAERTSSQGLRGQVLASPPGTGKTLSGFMTSLSLGAKTTLFIVPLNSVKKVWEATINTNFVDKPTYWTSLDGGLPTGKEEFIICHYEYFFKLERLMYKFIGRDDFCIWIDESHNFNEITSNRTQFLLEFVERTKPMNIVWASGTPFKALGKEVVPILYTIDPYFTDEVKPAFVQIFGASRARALDVLANRIGKFTYRIDKKDVVDIPRIDHTLSVRIPNHQPFLLDTVRVDLRKYIIQRVEYYKELRPQFKETYLRLVDKALRLVAYDPEALKLYHAYNAKMHKAFSIQDDMEKLRWCKKFEDDYVLPFLGNEDRKEFRYVISRHRTLLLVVRGEALGNVLVRRRIDCFRAMVPHMSLLRVIETARKKVMVFTSYVDVAKAVAEYLDESGIGNVLVIGETNKDFERIINDFKRDSDKKVVVATYKSLSTAVPVTEASDVFLVDQPFREYVLDQATSRAIRLGQDGPVRITTAALDTHGEPNLSTRNLDIMAWSKDMVDQMLGIKNGDELDDVEY